jgi:hypothetical protein
MIDLDLYRCGHEAPCGTCCDGVDVEALLHDAVGVGSADLPSTPVTSSGGTIHTWGGGTWGEVALRLYEALNEARQWRGLIQNLDRNENGRHAGEEDFGDPTGYSQGNPHLTPGQRIGTTYDGQPIVVPPHEQQHDASAWKRPSQPPANRSGVEPPRGGWLRPNTRRTP